MFLLSLFLTCVHLYICLSLPFSVLFSICLCVCLSLFCLFVHLSVRLSVYSSFVCFPSLLVRLMVFTYLMYTSNDCLCFYVSVCRLIFCLSNCFYCLSFTSSFPCLSLFVLIFIWSQNVTLSISCLASHAHATAAAEALTHHLENRMKRKKCFLANSINNFKNDKLNTNCSIDTLGKVGRLKLCHNVRDSWQKK